MLLNITNAYLRESSVLAACQSWSFFLVCFPSGALKKQQLFIIIIFIYV